MLNLRLGQRTAKMSPQVLEEVADVGVVGGRWKVGHEYSVVCSRLDSHEMLAEVLAVPDECRLHILGRSEFDEGHRGLFVAFLLHSEVVDVANALK